jgi:hypothetical protein
LTSISLSVIFLRIGDPAKLFLEWIPLLRVHSGPNVAPVRHCRPFPG